MKKMVYQCGLRLAGRLRSGGPSLGRSPGAHKQRRPVNQNQIQLFGKIGSTQFLEQGFCPALFSLSQVFFEPSLLGAEVSFFESGLLASRVFRDTFFIA
jgi:hypothetical protein